MQRLQAVELYEKALRGEAVWVRTPDGRMDRLPVAEWLDGALGTFESKVIRLCTGPTIDLGCGPGRFVGWLTQRGTPALGVDVSRFAVRMAQTRGAPALRRNVFGDLPGSGRWHHVLLMDGNIGIGANPGRLLERVRDLLSSTGTAIVEFGAPDTETSTGAIRLETGKAVSPWFPWTHVGIDVAADLAADAGLRVVGRHSANGRHLAVLERAS